MWKRDFFKRFLPQAIGSVRRMVDQREHVSHRYLTGTGIEIGALHNPLPVPKQAQVRYVDRLPLPELRQHYPELNHLPMVTVDVVDDGETLATLADASQDFVIANHFLEHCQNPIRALVNMFRVLKPQGILYTSVPDKRLTFDRDRPVTELSHLIRDYEQGPQISRQAAFEEYVRLVDKVTDPAKAREKIDHYLAIDYSIHYHAWTEVEMLELLVYLHKVLKLPFDVEYLARNEIEIVMILRK